MQPPSRRGFLSGSIATVVGAAGVRRYGDAAAGRLGAARLDETDALELIPAPDGVDATYVTLLRTDAGDATSVEDLDYQSRSVLESLEDLSVETVDRIVSVRTAGNGMLGSVVGSFDRLASGETVEEQGDWRIADHGRIATASVDGHAAVAATDSGTEFLRAAVEAAEGDREDVLDADDRAATTYDLLSERKLAYFIPDVGRGPFSDFDGVEAVAAGFDQNPSQAPATTENTYLLFLAADASLDDDAVERIVTELEPAEIVDLNVERTETYVRATTVAERPPQYDRDAAPAARIRSTVEDGTVTFEHLDGESVDVANLELWVDGELAEQQPDDEFETFAPGDRLAVPVDPLSTVTLRWFDESRNVYFPYAEELVGDDAFETDYDFDAERLTITYVGDRPADPSKLVIRRAGERSSGTSTRQFSDGEELAPGDSVTVDDVSTGERVSVELDVPERVHTPDTTLVRFHVRPPRVYVDREVGETVLYFGGRDDSDPENFRILVDGDPAGTQFADEYDTLSSGDELRLSEPPVGSELVVEWTRPDDPIEVAREVVRPRGVFDTTYDGSTGELTMVYQEGDVLDAADLTLRVDGEPAADQPSDEYDTLEPGDRIKVSAPPFAWVRLVWTGAEDVEHGLERTVTTSDAFEASYDADARAVDIVYLGQQEADPGRIDVVSGGRRRDRDDGPTVFEAAHDTLTRGDSVRVTDVGVEDWITVVLARADMGRHRPLFHYTPRPRRPFEFEEREDGVVATYRERVARDADVFRFLVDGEPAPTQPDDVHDTLRHGDEVDLGSHPGGTEIVVQWTALDEPRQVDEHIVVPDASFSFERSDDGDAVTIEHAGGVAVDAEDLVVLVYPADRMRRHDAWADAYDEVSEGDSITVETADERPVKLAGVQLSDGGVLDYERFRD